MLGVRVLLSVLLYELMLGIEVSFDYPRRVCFQCLRCALCCGDTETRVRHVLLLKREAELISEVTSRSIDAFATEVEGREPYVYEMRKTRKEGKCIFLEDNRCDIYLSRPLICRFYPFELRLTSNRRQEFRYTEECPGIGRDGQPLEKGFFESLLRQI